MFAALCGASRAADLPRPDEATDFLAPERLAEAHPRWSVAHRREAAVIGDLLVWPEISIGGLVDSNPLHQHHPGRSAGGIEVAPRFLVAHESGLHRTEAYAGADFRSYPTTRGADAFEGRTGVLHDWLLRPDLTLRMQGELARHIDPFDGASLLAPAAARGLVYETDALAAGSVQKSFDRVFVVLSGTALRAAFAASDHLSGSRLSDETVATGRVRVGYLFPSSVYAFAEPAANWLSLDRLPSASSGTRAIAGVGVQRFGLLSGEVFAGLQKQDYPGFRVTSTAPVVGGRIGWSPRRAWTFTATFDQGFGQAAVGTRADALGTPTRTETARAGVAYALTPLWRAQIDAGTTWIDYVGTPRSDRLAFADLRIDYALSRSFDVTGLLHVASLHSTVAAASYGRAAATLAASYHY